MAELPPEVQRLLDEARSADDPSAQDRERVRGALLASLAAGATTAAAGKGVAGAGATAGGAASAGAAQGGAVATSAIGSSLAIKWGTGLLIAAVGTTLAVTEPWRDAPAGSAPSTHAVPSALPREPVDQPNVSEPAVMEPVLEPPPVQPGAVAAAPGDAEAAPQDVAALPAAELAAEPAPRKRSAHKRRAKRPHGPEPAPEAQDQPAARVAPVGPSGEALEQPAGSSQELALIQSATRALHRGAPARALGVLGEHARRFPSGVLAEERRALRVLSLCELGRTSEGVRERDRFLARHPRSPLAERVRAACGTPTP